LTAKTNTKNNKDKDAGMGTDHHKTMRAWHQVGVDNEETMRMGQVMRNTEKGPGDVVNISWAIGKFFSCSC
jgi:hypothetical protein